MSDEVSKLELLAAHLMVFVLGPFFFRDSLGEWWSEPDYTMLAVSFSGCFAWSVTGLVVLEKLGLWVGI